MQWWLAGVQSCKGGGCVDDGDVGIVVVVTDMVIMV